MSSDPLRDLITSAVDALGALLAEYDEVVAATSQLKQVGASLANVRISHDKAFAQLTEAERLLAEAKQNHEKDMTAAAAEHRAVKAQVAEVMAQYEAKRKEVEATRQEHDQILASIESLR